jgi:hypothetical protein
LPLDKYIGNSFCAIQHNNNVDANLLIATVLRIKFVYWVADIRGIRSADALATPLSAVSSYVIAPLPLLARAPAVVNEAAGCCRGRRESGE